ncbi:MAG: hypothetical protein COC19_07615 [SAR86 cluster bacterium]|uniref:Glucose/Sorbosone dehydrogenase domain-containing protein n=1 Tax=SAR86 cluster bacterium TaxID=2030880 RepID=A0A2A4MGT4_9GAMM|nr:MAG: hypothetical protein COC19_07615 [SAR86 cluster bacterium]
MGATAQTGAVQPSVHHDFRITTVAEGLMIPWSMAWLPNGDMLVTERAGKLRIIRDGKLLATDVSGIPAVHAESQGGLFEVLPHPDFANNHLLYLSFAKPLGDNSTTTVIRGTFENDALSNVEEIFQAQTNGRSGHYGGRLAFDADGYLFITVGERQASPSGDLEAHPAQDTSNHHGVVVRLHDDGSVPNDNPFVGQRGTLPEIWSYGHRNPQGLAIHPATGDIWVGEHGPQGGDELNISQPGLNYGWPVIGFGNNYGTGSPIHSTQMRRGLERPLHFWVPSIATANMMIYSGDKFPSWQGNIFVGGLAGQQIARVSLKDDNKTIAGEETLLNGYGRVRDIRQGPDGYIYVAVESTGEIIRLEPAD